MQYALNFCDMMMEFNEQKIQAVCERRQYNRIYVGSYFCAFYFTNCNNYHCFFDYARKNDLLVTLVVPVLAQSIYDNSIIKIDKLINKYQPMLDEVVCNDVGMYEYIRQNFPSVSLILGRVLDRHNREEHNAARNHFTEDDRTYEIDGDWVNQVENNNQAIRNENIHIHHPFYYITYGRICLFSSINEPITQKFRPNRCQSMKCIGKMMRYTINESTVVFRRGCAVYGKVSMQLEDVGLFGRIIETPCEFEVE